MFEKKENLEKRNSLLRKNTIENGDRKLIVAKNEDKNKSEVIHSYFFIDYIFN